MQKTNIYFCLSQTVGLIFQHSSTLQLKIYYFCLDHSTNLSQYLFVYCWILSIFFKNFSKQHIEFHRQVMNRLTQKLLPSKSFFVEQNLTNSKPFIRDNSQGVLHEVGFLQLHFQFLFETFEGEKILHLDEPIQHCKQHILFERMRDKDALQTPLLPSPPQNRSLELSQLTRAQMLRLSLAFERRTWILDILFNHLASFQQ